MVGALALVLLNKVHYEKMGTNSCPHCAGQYDHYGAMARWLAEPPE
jgi:hypothetical protein